MPKRFEGEFFLPTVKEIRTPIPFVGKGFCEVSIEGFRVNAHWERSRNSQALGFAFVAMLLEAFLFLQFNIDIKIIAGIFVAIVLPISALIFNSKVGETVDVVIPWQYIIKTERMSEASSTFQTVFVTIMGFKLEGELCFLPVSGGKKMIQEMNAARKSFFFKKGKKVQNFGNKTIIIER